VALILTVVIAPTIVIITPAMAEIIALMPLPIAEKIEPCGDHLTPMLWIHVPVLTMFSVLVRRVEKGCE